MSEGLMNTCPDISRVQSIFTLFTLSTLNQVDLPWNKNNALRVYCLAGTRSRRAVKLLQKTKYTNVKNNGGIIAYKGVLEK